MASRSKTFITIEKRIRSSQPYFEWVKRNKGHSCFMCSSKENLELHHDPPLSSYIVSKMKLFSNTDEIINEIITLHSNDDCDSVTMCSECHDKNHKVRIQNDTTNNTVVDLWCVGPSPFNMTLCPARSDSPPGSIGFIAFQSLLGLGYHILNGDVDDRILEISSYRRFAELIGKKPTSSFANLLDNALTDLKVAGAVNGHARSGSAFEIHIDRKYMLYLRDHYWFFPLSKLPSKSMLSLSIKWILNKQNKPTYALSFDNLCKHTGLSTKNPSMARKYIKAAMKHIPNTSIRFDNGMCRFRKDMRGPKPVHSLRAILVEAIESSI